VSVDLGSGAAKVGGQPLAQQGAAIDKDVSMLTAANKVLTEKADTVDDYLVLSIEASAYAVVFAALLLALAGSAAAVEIFAVFAIMCCVVAIGFGILALCCDEHLEDLASIRKKLAAAKYERLCIYFAMKNVRGDATVAVLAGENLAAVEGLLHKLRHSVIDEVELFDEFAPLLREEEPPLPQPPPFNADGNGQEFIFGLLRYRGHAAQQQRGIVDEILRLLNVDVAACPEIPTA
jgi:hypothetical protein